jgi:PAS domain S-box-containing protein
MNGIGMVKMTHKGVAQALFFALGFLFALFLIHAYLYDRFEREIESHLLEASATQEVAWEAILRMHKIAMSTFFEEYITHPQTLEILKQAQTPQSRDEAREALYAYLKSRYERLKDHGVLQLHFHLSDHTSLLRFHAPDRFGDDLTASRHSVVQANTALKPVFGFEAGRVVSGFRHVWPVLTPEGEHLGSVELSLPFGAIRHQISQLLDDRHLELVISAAQLRQRLFDDRHQDYTPWIGDSRFLEQHTHTPFFQGSSGCEACRELATQLRHDLRAQSLIDAGRSGSVLLREGGDYYIATLTAARDTQDRLAGYLISYDDAPHIQQLETAHKQATLLSAGLLTGLFIALWLLLKSRSDQAKARRELEAIYAAMGEGLYVMDREGRITHTNDAASKMLGYPRDALIGQIAHDLFHSHGEDQPTPLEACPIFRTILTGQPYDGEERFRRKDGSCFCTQTFSRPLIKHGEVIGAVTTFSDITEAKRQQRELAEKERLLHTIYDVLPVGISVTDEAGHIIDCNHTSEKLLGITKAEHLARNYAGKEWTILHPDGTVMPPEAFASVIALQENRTVRDQEMGVAQGEQTVWITVSAMPIELKGYGVVIAYVDITERRRAREELEWFNEKLAEQVEGELARRMQSEAKYRTLFNAVPDAIFVHGFTPEGPDRFSEVNDAACTLLGADREKILTLSPADLNPERTPEQMQKMAERIQKSNQAEIQEQLTDTQGRKREVITMVRVIFLGDQPTAITVVHDLTELKRLQSERESQQAVLIQQSKLAELGSMIGAIAHQWKQPLNAVSLIAQGLVDTYDYGELDRDELVKESGKILKQVHFMAQTVDDFRNFYKPDRQSERFNPKAACEQVIDLLSAQLQKHQITITLGGEDRLSVTGYPSEFKQVILNLINNAKDALIENQTPDPAITVTVESRSDRAVVGIEDNGGGIPEALLPDRLFEAMVSTKGAAGTGIGLSLAKTIIEEKMRGQLSATNTARGACFEICLPLD